MRLLSGADDEELVEVAGYTGLSRLLRTLPMGAETPLSAGGQNISSGQRQLITLTAAFASNRPVLLLDESTSQIDQGTRSHFDWPRLTAGRTIVQVEHA